MQLVRLVRRRRDDRGAVLILGALFASVAIVAAALSIDIGALVLEKRSNQRIADLAALDGVRGLSAAVPQRDDVERIAIESARRNGFDIDPATATRTCTALTDSGATYAAPGGETRMTIEIGTYTADNDDNFTAKPCPVASVLEALFPVNADAVKVTVSSPVSFNFMPGGGRETASAVSKLGTTPPVIPTTTTVPTGPTTTIPGSPGTEEGGVRVGSRMASVSTTHAAVLNAVLAAANNPAGNPLGNPPGSLNISAVGYDGLAAMSMTLDELATELGINAGTVDQVLTADFSYDDLISAMILIADRNNQDEVALTLQELQAYSIPLNYSALHQTISLDEFTGPYVTGGGSTFDGSSVADGAINVLEVVRGGAVLADGNHLVSAPLNATTAPIPLPTGVTAATASIELIEAAQYHYGTLTKTAKTAQLRTTLVLTVPVDLGALGLASIDIPVIIEGGGAEATAMSMACDATHTLPVSIDIVAVANTLTGQTGPWAISVLGGLVNISAAPGAVVPSSGSGGSWTFTDFLAVETVTPAQLGALSVDPSTINVSGPLPLGTTVGTVTGAIATQLNPVLSTLNSTVMGPLYNALGVGFGSADVSPTQPDGKTLPVCTPGTGPIVGPTTTTTAPAPTTTIPGNWTGIPTLVD